MAAQPAEKVEYPESMVLPKASDFRDLIAAIARLFAMKPTNTTAENPSESTPTDTPHDLET